MKNFHREISCNIINSGDLRPSTNYDVVNCHDSKNVPDISNIGSKKLQFQKVNSLTFSLHVLTHMTKTFQHNRFSKCRKQSKEIDKKPVYKCNTTIFYTESGISKIGKAHQQKCDQ